MPIEDIPICSGSEFHQVLEGNLFKKWQEGKPTVLRIQPEHVETRIEKAVNSILENNGTYVAGDNVVIHSRHDALSLAVEIGYVLKKYWDCNPCIIYFIPSNPPLANKLVSSLPDQAKLERITKQYMSLTKFADHWIVPYGTPKDEPNETEKNAISTFIKFFGRGVSELSEKRHKRILKSQDLITFPIAHEGERLNLSFEEWTDIMYKALSVTKERLEKDIASWQYLKALEGAYHGKTIKVYRGGNYPVNLTMKLEGRAVIKDIGKVGENAIFGKHYSSITNYPPGEVFTTPIEETVNGEIYSGIPLITERGTIEDYHLIFKNGRVMLAEASKGEDALRYYVGLATPKDENEKQLYAIMNIAAELGFGMNPFLQFDKTTGNGLVDEKMKGMHFATGSNTSWGGKNPDSIAGYDVEHTDFIIGRVDKVYCV